MKIKTISGICFALAFSCMLLLVFDIRIQYISRSYLILGLFGFGLVGAVLNLLNADDSPHKLTYSIVYWVGNILILIGLAFRLMHWPFATIILLIGCLVLGVSFFLPKKRTKESDDQNDLIDNF